MAPDDLDNPEGVLINSQDYGFPWYWAFATAENRWRYSSQPKITEGVYLRLKKWTVRVMITPWNHFHLCWLALKLGDQQAAERHALVLTDIGIRGDVRAGRFVARVLTWPVFAPLRESHAVRSKLDAARTYFAIGTVSERDRFRTRLLDIWQFYRDHRDK